MISRSNILYTLLCLMRLGCSLLPGYVHPDEFFQSPEIMAGDVLGYEVYRPWEFNEHLPSRSIFIPLVLLLPFDLIVHKWSINSFGEDDYAAYNIAYLYQKNGITTSDPTQALFLVAFSHVLLIFHTRPFSNAVESIILALCFYIYLRGTLSKDFAAKKKDTEIQNTNFPTNMAFILGCLGALGLFTRITFILFAFPIGLAFLYRTFMAPEARLNTWNEKFNRLIPVGIGFVVASGLCVLTDLIYFGSIKVTVVKKEWFSFDFLVRILQNPLDFLEIVSLSGNVILTPINNVLYNLDANNLAEHGLHPRYVHVINYFMLFGPLGIYNIIDFYTSLKNFRQVSLMKSATVLTFSGICGFILLSIMPHQEARFLLPLLLPVVISASLHRKFSSRFWVFYVLFNLITALFFGGLHQAGIIPVLGKLQHQSMGFHNCVKDYHKHVVCEVTNEFEPSFNSTEIFHTNVIFYKTFMPPRHLLGYPKAWRESNIQITIHDLAGVALEQLEQELETKVAVNADILDQYADSQKIVFQEREDILGHYERTLIVTPSTTILSTSHSLKYMDRQWPHLNTDQIDRVLENGLYLNIYQLVDS
ncbi:5028_t:CDS:10 [Ambispora leptoticha]|uniref:Mannosyltransferase n=1 Tax=Ambispora leptoticha TaxID=144679 RepID=A0A9N8WCW8_9GLOM|nr:5028_t:CDS:10 [Ambispora leptoticha]